MHKQLDLSAAFEPAKYNRFRTLYSTLREWNVARIARRQQADALFGLDAHILDDIGISKAMVLDCETCSSIYPDPARREPDDHEVKSQMNGSFSLHSIWLCHRICTFPSRRTCHDNLDEAV